MIEGNALDPLHEIQTGDSTDARAKEQAQRLLDRYGYIVVGSNVKFDVGARMPYLTHWWADSEYSLRHPMGIIGLGTRDESIEQGHFLGYKKSDLKPNWTYYYKVAAE